MATSITTEYQMASVTPIAPTKGPVDITSIALVCKRSMCKHPHAVVQSTILEGFKVSDSSKVVLVLDSHIKDHDVVACLGAMERRGADSSNKSSAVPSPAYMVPDLFCQRYHIQVEVDPNRHRRFSRYRGGLTNISGKAIVGIGEHE